MSSGGHHEFAPSSLYRLMLCPGSYAACAELPDDENIDAERGTRMHEFMTGKRFPAGVLNINDESTCCILLDKFVKPLEGRARIYHELRLQVKDSDGSIITEGTGDFIAIASGIGCLYDWKFGFNAVEPAEENIQLKAYAVGVFQMFPEVQRLFVQVVQPAVSMAFEETTFGREHVPLFISQIKNIIEGAKKPDAYRNAGEVQCRYCKARNTCPDRVKWLDGIGSSLVEMPTVDLSTLEKADETRQKISLVEKRLDELKKEADAVILTAGGSDNFCVVRESTTSKVDYKALCESLHPEPGIVEQFTSETTRGAFVTPRRKKKK